MTEQAVIFERWLSRGFLLGLIYVLCVTGVLEVFRFRDPTALILGAAVFVATPALAARACRGVGDLVMTLFAVQIATRLRTPPSGPWDLGFAVLTYGTIVVAGVALHCRFVGLERRLAALKGATP